MAKEWTPPHCKSTEQAFLGAILQNPAALSTVPGWFKPSYFYVFVHRKIFAAINDLAGRGQEVDYYTVANRLSEMGHLADLGGLDYFVTIKEASMPWSDLA